LPLASIDRREYCNAHFRSPHQRYVDAQLDAQDAKDRQQLIMEKANEQATLKVAKESE